VRAFPASIFVEDNGPGIDASERERVLDPFYRTPQSAGDGCGLGLAIAREIAARHGALLRIVSRDPEGTRVEVVFGGEGGASASE
jgi:two-component system sensor histidine kinase TctE